MIVYEVNLEIAAAVYAEYRSWLNKHVRELLALPGFLSAEIFEINDPPAKPATHNLCVQYRLEAQADLDRYLREHAPRLREEGLRRFPGQFQANRRMLSLISS